MTKEEMLTIVVLTRTVNDELLERVENDEIYGYDDEDVAKGVLERLSNQPSISPDVDKAAEEYAYTNWEDDDYHEGAAEGLPFDPIGFTEKVFKDGVSYGMARRLTWRDVKDLHRISDDYEHELAFSEEGLKQDPSEEEMYTEVIRRFNEYRAKAKDHE